MVPRTSARVRELAVVVLGVLVAAAAVGSDLGCSSGGGGKVQDASTDFAIDYVFGDLPPGCPPAAPNDKGIGKACTKGGSECSAAQICTCNTYLGVTPPADTPCFCTIPILNLAGSQSSPCDSVPAGTCGQNTTCCGYQTVAAICVPNACLGAAGCPVF